MEETKQFEYSKNYTRTAAYIIDSLILFTASATLQLPITISLGLYGVPDYVDFIITYIISLILHTIYFTYFLTKDGTTPGLNYLGLKILKEDGSLLSVGDVIIRTLFFNIFFLISILTIPFTSKSQGIHDMVVRSVCLKNEEKMSRGKWITGSCCGCGCLSLIILIILFFVGVANQV